MGADSGRSWAERRGIESIDLNTGLVLARTGIEELAREIAAGSKSWERDVLGKHVRVATDFGWVFRIEGHPWSIFLYESYSRFGSAAEFSARLSVPVITYDCSDTMGAIGYVYAEGGRMLESLSLVDGEVELTSELRDLEIAPSEAFRVVDHFFREHDVYEPGIYTEYFLGDGRNVPQLTAGEKRLVGNPGFILVCDGAETTLTPPLERVDYLVFR